MTVSALSVACTAEQQPLVRMLQKIRLFRLNLLMFSYGGGNGENEKKNANQKTEILEEKRSILRDTKRARAGRNVPVALRRSSSRPA